MKTWRPNSVLAIYDAFYRWEYVLNAKMSSKAKFSWQVSNLRCFLLPEIRFKRIKRFRRPSFHAKLLFYDAIHRREYVLNGETEFEAAFWIRSYPNLFGQIRTSKTGSGS
jgi:hypothetical protein